MTREAREAVAAMRAGVRGVLNPKPGGTDAAADADGDADAWEEEWKEEWEDVAPEDVGGGDGGGGVSEIPPPDGHRPARSSEHVLPTSPVLPAQGCFTTQSTIEVRETPENALALANLRNACRGARRRSVPALAAALALLAKLAPEEEAGEAGVSAAARAATLNELAAVKRDLVDWLGRCRSIGIEEAEAEIRDEKAGGAEEEAEVSFRASPSGHRRDDSGALVVAVPQPHGVADVAGGDPAGGASRNETPETPGGGSALDDLLERARRRQRGARARATNARDPRAPAGRAPRTSASTKQKHMLAAAECSIAGAGRGY